MNIKVGLIFKNSPKIKEPDAAERIHICEHYGLPSETPLHIVGNLLIGKSFHWESEIKAIFPGELNYDQKTDTIINTLPLDLYLKNVVGSEMNPLSPLEFLKAHAIVSRSWAVGKIMKTHNELSSDKVSTPDEIIGWCDTSDHIGFHVCSDDHCQRYQGLQQISPEADSAINSTTGLVLVDNNGDVIDARFSKCCGGHTELFSSCWQNTDLPYLEAFPDPWCDYSSMSESARSELLDATLKRYDRSTGTGFSWSVRISKIDIRRNLANKFRRDIGEIQSILPVHRGLSGRITKLLVIGSEGSCTIGKELYIRRLLSPDHLFSSNFTVTDCGSYFRLDGHGWGHGVGMCQTGAARMAYEGHTAEEILKFYYPSADIKKIY